MNSNIKAHAAVLAGNFFFGAGVVAVKHLIPDVMPPLALNVLRVGVALILFWFMFLLKPTTASIKKKHVPLFLLCAITGIVINQILFIKGTSLTSGIHTSLLALSTPIAITIFAFFLLKQKPTITKIAGLVLGIAGALVLILVKNIAEADSSVKGDLFIIGNAISYALYLVIVTPLMETYKPIHVIRWVFLFGACFIIPIGFNDFTKINWQYFLWHHWFALGFMVIGSTFLSYLSMVYGIAKLGASTVASYIYTQPVFATITSMILFGEKITLVKIVAALLIFSGVYLVNKKLTPAIENGIEKV